MGFTARKIYASSPGRLLRIDFGVKTFQPKAGVGLMAATRKSALLSKFDLTRVCNHSSKSYDLRADVGGYIYELGVVSLA